MQMFFVWNTRWHAHVRQIAFSAPPSFPPLILSMLSLTRLHFRALNHQIIYLFIFAKMKMKMKMIFTNVHAKQPEVEDETDDDKDFGHT